MSAVVDVEYGECSICGESKPASEFYRDSTRWSGLASRCKTCDNTRPRQTRPRILRTRARQRAAQDLIQAHREEFQHLYEVRLSEAYEEADRLAATTTAQDVYSATETPRLMSGARKVGEEAEDRVNRVWCSLCARFHIARHNEARAKTLPLPDGGRAK